MENKKAEKLLKEALEHKYTHSKLRRLLLKNNLEREAKDVLGEYTILIQEKKEIKQANNPWLFLIALIIGTVLVTIDKNVVQLAIPHIMTFFGITLSTTSWIISIYVLANAVFIPIFGKMGARYGHRKVFIFGFMSFALVSLLSGISWNISSLIFFRALQGITGASIYPSAMSLITKKFQDRRIRAEMLGWWSVAYSSAIALGPLIGGPLIDYFSWRSVFFINLPISLIGLAMVLVFVPKDYPEEVGKFDYLGSLFMGVFISSMILFLDKGVDWGWFSFRIILLLGICVLFLFLFIFRELRASNPVVDLKLFKNRNLVSALLTLFFSQGLFFGGGTLVLSLFAQEGLKFSATTAGYLFFPMLMGYAFFSPLGAKMACKIGPKLVIFTGLILSIVCMFVLANSGEEATFIQLAIPLMLIGVGMGVGNSLITSATTSSVEHSQVGTAAALLNLMRNLAVVFGVAIASTVLSLGFSYKSSFIIFAIFLCISALTSLFSKESKKDYQKVENKKIEIPKIRE